MILEQFSISAFFVSSIPYVPLYPSTSSGFPSDKVINDYFRQEGRYKNKVLNNLQLEAFQSMRAKEAYRLGQEFNSKAIPPVDTLPSFAASSINYASDYYAWRDSEEQKKILKEQMEQYG